MAHTSAEDDFLHAANGGLVKVDFSEDDPDDIYSVTPSPTEQMEIRNPPPLMDIYSIKFLKNSEEAEIFVLPHIFGVIVVEGSSGSSILFNRKVGDPRLVNRQGFVKLSDMRQGLKVESDILIKSYLFVTELVSFNNKPPGRLWRINSNKCRYDKLLVTQIECGFSKIEVQYAVSSKATEAIVDVTLIDLAGQDSPEFHGTVKAWNTQVTSAISCLFEEEGICASVGEAGSGGLSIHLSRCAIVVPCNSSLIVHADICRGNVMFATGTTSFPAKSGDEEVQMIHGTGGMIVVKVTWLEIDGSDEVQQRIVDGGSNTIPYHLCDSSSRPNKMPRLDDLYKRSLRSFGDGDGTDMEMEFEIGPYSSDGYERDLLEVFSVKFVNHENINISSIYGTIFIDVGLVSFILYNRKLGDPPRIDSEGFVTLTAPRHGMDLSGQLELCHYLFDLNRQVISKSLLWWCETSFRPLVYDQVLSWQLESEFGSIEVTAAIYCPGAEATLAITLLDCEEECPIEIYGHVKVKNNRVCDSRAVSWLFKKKTKEEATCVRRDIPGGSITVPLLRHAVVVPLGSKMIVDACIQYGNMVFSSGVRSFKAKYEGNESKVIKGGRGKIKIDVSWRYLSHAEKSCYCW